MSTCIHTGSPRQTWELSIAPTLQAAARHLRDQKLPRPKRQTRFLVYYYVVEDRESNQQATVKQQANRGSMHSESFDLKTPALVSCDTKSPLFTAPMKPNPHRLRRQCYGIQAASHTRHTFLFDFHPAVALNAGGCHDLQRQGYCIRARILNK